MNDPTKTRQAQMRELSSLRKRIAELVQAQSQYRQMEERLTVSEHRLRGIIANAQSGYFFSSTGTASIGRSTQELAEWLRVYNAEVSVPERKVSFSGLDLYSMYTSAFEVVRYLDRVDPVAAQVARERYGRLNPWQDDPAAYGRAALVGRMQSCEEDVIAMLREMLAKRIEYSAQDGDEFFDAAQNARVVAGA